jgi:prepilin-type N-terminal cleavage/methylation domain-containing protein
MNATISGSRKLGGFSLVEMAIVMLIISLLLAGLLPAVSGQIEQQRRNETRKQLAEIQQALLGFALMNGRLPCPVDPTITNPANAGYGQEAVNCQGNAAAEGYLPWQTLGVSEIDAWGTKRSNAGDPWNGYWRYRVDRNFANAASPITMTTPFSSDQLTIQDSAGNSLTSGSERPIAIVFSAGPDLIGNGQNANTTEPNPSFEPTGGIYRSDVPGTGFDDILVWISRPQLFNRMVAAGKLP